MTVSEGGKTGFRNVKYRTSQIARTKKGIALIALEETSRAVYNVANVSIGNSIPVAMSVFTLVRSYSPYVGTADLEHYFLVATNTGIINLTMVVSANPYGHPIPPYAASGESISLHNSTFVLPPISSVQPLDQGKIPQIMPAYSASASLFGGSDPNLGRIFAVTQSTTNSSYYLTEIMDSGLNIAWIEKLPVSSPPSGIQMYGSFFTHSQSQLIVLADQNSMLAYHMPFWSWILQLHFSLASLTSIPISHPVIMLT